MICKTAEFTATTQVLMSKGPDNKVSQNVPLSEIFDKFFAVLINLVAVSYFTRHHRIQQRFVRASETRDLYIDVVCNHDN